MMQGSRSLFLAVFAPEGWPTSVAPEYGRYQLWDTIQQVTFFVNTVISKQAVMKFHGVGDPSTTPAEAAALEMGRGLLASVVSLLIATPGFLELYRLFPRVLRMTAEMVNATGHLVEILAAIFSSVVALLYLGPVLCTLAGTMSGAVRSVILQHFARGGELPPGRDPDFGDIALKESNQDKAGKIVGLIIGVGLLLGFIGLGSGGAAEQASLYRSLQWFWLLSIVHVLGNVKAVLQLRIPPMSLEKQLLSRLSAVDGARGTDDTPFLRKMFLPKGYPHTVVDSYARFRLYTLANSVLAYPMQTVTSMLFWQNVYGVGNASMTPLRAVMIDIFMASVDSVAGLLAGLPIVTQSLDYGRKVWFLRAAVIEKIADTLRLGASLAGPGMFFPLIIASGLCYSFAGTSSSRVNGALPNALMRKESAERKEVELIHINIASTNQDRLVRFPSGILSIALLYYIAFTGWQPCLEAQLCAYFVLQVLSLCCQLGRYNSLPPLPGQAVAGADDMKRPLL